MRIIGESRRYPSQAEAEALVEWINAIDNLSFGGSSIVRREFEKADKIRIVIWDRIFGDTSPWAVRKGRREREVYWDEQKAKNIGL